MVEEILEATSALCLSPRKRRPFSSRILFINALDRCKDHLLPALTKVHGIAAPSLDLSSDDLEPAGVAVNLTHLPSTAAHVKPDLSMPRGVKRPRPASGQVDAETRSPSAFKQPKYDNNDSGLHMREPIVISDSDDDDPVDGTAEDRQAKEDAIEELSPSAIHRQNLAKQFTYRSPTKKLAAHKANKASRLKLELPKSESSTSQISDPPSSSARPLLELKAEAAALVTAAAESSSAASTSKKAKAKKGVKRTTLQLKKTVGAAKEAAIEPLDLSKVLSAGFRLLLRCSFCAGTFTKSCSPKAKQEHMSLCAPLLGIKRSAVAVETISSDITSALQRDEEEKKRVSDERTVLQNVMQDADIIMHEGRASQIATSPKKRGRDKVILKKSVKRSTRPQVFVAEDASPQTHASAAAPRSAAHRLLPAREAASGARHAANQLLGGAIYSAVKPTEAEGSRETSTKLESNDPPLDEFAYADMPRTPKKARRNLSAKPSHADADDSVDDSHCLPKVSAEEVFATMAAASPHKSPVKALQKSRERQRSREQEMSFELGSSASSPGSPDVSRTQPFAPSKLARRREIRDGEARAPLFSAETTTRSLLDLIGDNQRQTSRESSADSKRKADDDGAACESSHAKRLRPDEPDREHVLLLSSTDLLPAPRRHAHGNASRTDVQGMDIDDNEADTEPSSEPECEACSSPRKVQKGRFITDVSANSTAANPLDGDQQQSSPQDQPGATNGRSDVPVDTEDDLLPSMDLEISDHLEQDDDDDNESVQSFFDMLEPTEVLHESVPSPTCSLSDPSSEDAQEPDTTLSAYRHRRMSVACGGATLTPKPRLRGRRSSVNARDPSPSSSSLPQATQKVQFQQDARESSISNSDPDVVLFTDDSYTSSPQP